MPYFEGDFWPNILEESIKELEQEEMEKRRREEEEAAADTDDGESLVSGDRVEVGFTFECLLLFLTHYCIVS
jgi:Histone acetylation protein